MGGKKQITIKEIKELKLLRRLVFCQLKTEFIEHSVPPSCCRSSKFDLCERSINDVSNISTLFQDGCLDKINMIVNDSTLKFLMCCSGIILLEVLILITMFLDLCLK